MGWDAYSTAWNKQDKNSLTALSMFRAKGRYISQVLKCDLDADFMKGGLNLKGCRNMIQEYTNIGCYTNLDSEQVKEKYKKFPSNKIALKIINKEDLMYFYNAKYFLETCIKYNLGIKFG